jgi:hypothetical protein
MYDFPPEDGLRYSTEQHIRLIKTKAKLKVWRFTREKRSPSENVPFYQRPDLTDEEGETFSLLRVPFYLLIALFDSLKLVKKLTKREHCDKDGSQLSNKGLDVAENLGRERSLECTQEECRLRNIENKAKSIPITKTYA